MKKALTVSIVIPVYNEQHHLKACLDSITEQSILPNEVIVVDNNSTDESISIARSYPFVRVVKELQQGVMWGRNAGFDAAKYDLIGRIDADTQLPNDWIKRLLTLFTTSDVAAVSGPVGWHDAPAKQIGLFIDKNVRRVTWRLGTKVDAVFMFGSNMAIRRDAWLSVRNEVCMRKDVHEDVDLAIHLYEHGFLVIFDPHLTAMTSSRRMNDSLEQLKKYLAVYKNTYYVHGIKTTAVKLPTVLTLTTHFGVKLIKRGYNPETGEFSIKRFVESKPESRIHPM